MIITADKKFICIIAAICACAFLLLASCDTLDEVDLSKETPPTYVKPEYSDNGDGTITDTTTNGIMWVSGSASQIPYSTAYSHCENLSLAGYTDWRLPTIAELETLGFDDANYSWFQDYSTLKAEYWFSSDLENNVFVYSIQLSTKKTSKTYIDSTTSTRYVRCARAVQP